MSVREVIGKDPIGSIQQLLPWAKDKNEYLRRFASEATRPRGVWAKHIGAFKLDPTPALPLLEQLVSDQSRYVQDSVANWLNDAGKDHPHWVRDVTMDWMRRSNTRETAYIVKRATRGINRT
jgi:3-methyladenine DNA glycosylase AlkC